jgi:hypothetical protein
MAGSVYGSTESKHQHEHNHKPIHLFQIITCMFASVSTRPSDQSKEEELVYLFMRRASFSCI